ncbi:MAG: catalase [Lachnospiraceae bacterium]|nr:catalase [Lachnospiraceae bacterium]
MHIWEHFKTITHHKFMVMKGCFSVGLYKQGLLHDLSKYMPSEFLVGARYFQGTQSPNNAERKEKGYSSAWLHHKGRNKHHYEYWMDYSSHAGEGIIPAKMPERYVVEMFIDRVAASKNYNKENYTDDMPLKYYQSGNPGSFMHKETNELLEKLLYMLADEGEAKTMQYIRKEIIPHIRRQNKRKDE